jgi:hypothetical protein
LSGPRLHSLGCGVLCALSHCGLGGRDKKIPALGLIVVLELKLEEGFALSLKVVLRQKLVKVIERTILFPLPGTSEGEGR